MDSRGCRERRRVSNIMRERGGKSGRRCAVSHGGRVVIAAFSLAACHRRAYTRPAMPINRTPVIQAFFIGGAPRIAQRMRAAAPAAAATIQAHPASQIVPLDAGRLNLSGNVGEPLPVAIQRKMEAFFGADFSDVRVHSGPQAHAIGAIAFTLGSSIYFAPGQYRPETPRGQQVLGHELAHVLQQRAGRVRNPQGSGIAIVQDVLLEAEAEHLGARAAAFSVPVHTQRRGPTG